MKRILGVLTPKASMLKTVFLALFVLAPLVSTATPASAATAYYVRVNDVYARRQPQSYAMGRLYKDQRMDIQYIDSNGWAWGYMYGWVGRCVWAQYRVGSNTPNFWTHGTTVSNKCGSPRYLSISEFSNGEIWKDPYANDGLPHRLTYASYKWDNWAWGQAWGNHYYRGVAGAGEVWRIRYTTNDGAGVLARGPCWWDGAAQSWRCPSDWQFIQRGAL